MTIAKDALAAQRDGIDVTAHNIANVNTPGYTRQTIVQEARQPLLYGGVLRGIGLEASNIIRSSDQFIEGRLMDQRSTLQHSKEMENYLRVLEGLFNESSETSLSGMLANYWNLWHDISNNPSEAPERTALYEYSLLLSRQFSSLAGDLSQLETDLTNAVVSEIDKINEITYEISQINEQIVGMAALGTPNDLVDNRNNLVSELSEYIDVKAFEQDDGTLTIISAKGSVLVHLTSNYDLQIGGPNGDRVEWQGSGGAVVDITDYITTGKLGGSLDMRDEIVAKYELDLDAVAKEFIWAVNRQHSQGVGLEAFSTATGSYQASSTAAALDSSGLDFEDDIVDGGFRLWLYDSNGNYDSDTTLTIDADVTSIDDIVADINAIDAAKISATSVDNKLQITGVNGFTFAFSDDTSHALAALGMNTFFTGANAGGMGVNDNIGLEKNFIAAAQITNNVGPAVADTGNNPAGTGTIVTDGHYTGAADATYEIQISTGGAVGVAEFQWRKDGGAWSGAILTTGGFQAVDVDGVEVKFMPGTYVANDTFSINVTADSAFYGVTTPMPWPLRTCNIHLWISHSGRWTG
jgi:flagellar hook-associated protein 1 FlgK